MNTNKPSFFGRANELRQAVMFKPQSPIDKESKQKWEKEAAKDTFHKSK